MKKTIKSAFIGYVVTGLMVCLSLSLNAAPFTWDGSGLDNNWLTDGNWNPDGAPAQDTLSTLIFGGEQRTGTVNNYPPGTVFAGITFANDYSTGKKAAFTNSGASITLGGDVVTTLPTVAGTLVDTIAHDMILSGTRTFTVSTNGTMIHNLIVSGVISESGGAQGLIKAGGGTLTLSGTNSYSGLTTVNAGALILSGSLSNSSVVVTNGAGFTETAVGVIAGAGVSLTAYSSMTLSGTNTYGGVTSIGIANTTSNLTLSVNNNRALGSTAAGTTVNGGVTANAANKVLLNSGVTVTDETLTLAAVSGQRAGLYYNLGSGTGTWDGNIVLSAAAGYFGCDTSGGTLVIGGSSADTVTGAGSGLSLRGNGTVRVNSRINIGGTQLSRDDPGTGIINSTSNVWGNTALLSGTLKLGVSDALPITTFLTVGKAPTVADATFDLNGYNQTVAGLYEGHAIGTGKQRILSASPATLTVSNNAANTFGTTNSTMEGKMSLVKKGTGTLTLTGTNSFSGSLTVMNGTNVISATGTMGINCTNVIISAGTLKLMSAVSISDAAIVTIADGGAAKMELAAGVEETVMWLNFGATPKLPGRYSATGGSGIIVDTVHFAGTGVLKVLRGPTATLILFR